MAPAEISSAQDDLQVSVCDFSYAMGEAEGSRAIVTAGGALASGRRCAGRAFHFSASSIPPTAVAGTGSPRLARTAPTAA